MYFLIHCKTVLAIFSNVAFLTIVSPFVPFVTLATLTIS